MKLILVVGARPNFMKIAPLIRTIDKRNSQSPTTSHQSPVTTNYLLVHTGQHYDYEMSQVFFQDLELPKPDIHLDIGSGTHAEQTGQVLIAFEKVLLQQKPDLVVVVGDINSTLAAALAAVKLHLPIAHVEAGIRSFDWAMPEEINRLLTDHISQYLFTTSEYDDRNLKKEGIPSSRIFRVGNIMVDSLLYNITKAANSTALSRLGLTKQNYALLTLHRPSNVDDQQNLTKILVTLAQIGNKTPIIFPAHPRTQKMLKQFNLNPQPESKSNISIIPPLGYLDFLNLEMNSKFVITDSGGIQVETTVLGIPCLTVLDSPVWHITHKQGTNTLVGSDCQRLVPEAFKILDGKGKRGKRPHLWDGQTAPRIINVLLR